MSNVRRNNPDQLLLYLTQAYLPMLIVKDSVPEVRRVAHDWGHMPELSCTPGHHRKLKKINEIPLLALENAVRVYFAGLQDRPNLVVDWENTSLTMPSPGMKVLDNKAIRYLMIQSEEDYTRAVRYFMLNTAAEVIRTVEGRPFDDDDDELQFQRYRIQGVQTARKIATMYVFGEPVPPTGILRPGIVMLSLPPWQFGIGDFEEFTSRRKFEPGEFDADMPEDEGPSQWSSATKLWAMLYDSCTVSGYRWFVVTSYNYWVFGTWSLDWSTAELTPPVPFDKTHGMSLVELLVFWTESARHRVRYWQLAPNAEAE